MATITKKQILNDPQYGGKPEGNDAVRPFTLKTLANGSVEGSDVATATQIADVVRIGVLRRGFRIDDALLIISTGWTASVTGKIGFAYADGVDDATVPQDDDYFIAAGAALSTAARTRANNTAVFPVTLPKDAYIILTLAGAANAKASRIDLLVYGEDRGPL
jgi:hypothetical protein